MHIHTAIFVVYIFAVLADKSSNWYIEQNIKSADALDQCRYQIVELTFGELHKLANCALIILFAYMSIRYSQPMKTYWSNIANQQIEIQPSARTSAQNSERSFNRANETTIEILQALVRTKENIDISQAMSNDFMTDSMDEDSD